MVDTRGSCVAVAGLLDKGVSIKYISCGTHHNAAISVENIMYTWGSNKYGCLGVESELEFISTPTRVRRCARLLSMRRRLTSAFVCVSLLRLQVWAFDVMISGVGRGSPRSVSCGNDFTVTACFPYVGPSEEELVEVRHRGHSVSCSDARAAA